MSERAYLSIGEVLALLKDEFTDITISKIRFLESQGLIDPERTPSGYRKFYEPDVERLRWILRQQKEHYLPLRVIKGKLSSVQAGDVQAGGGQSGDVRGGEAPAGGDVEDEERDVQPSPPPALAAVPDPPEEEAAPEAEEAVAGAVAVIEPEPEPEPSPEPAREPAALTASADVAPRSAPPFPESLRRSARSSPAAFLSSPEPPRHLRFPSEAAPPAQDGAGPAEPQDGGDDRADEMDLDEAVELTADELGIVAGLPALAVAELERYGLIKGQPSPGGRYYDAAALEIATLASAFARYGVEPRHLRMWKTAATREADFYEQVVTPLRSQRSNKTRRQASETVVELADLGARLHVALVAGTLKRLT